MGSLSKRLVSALMERKGAGEEYEDRYEKTGKKAKKDWDGDGEVEDDAEEYAGVKDNAIKKAMGKDKDEDEEEEKSKKMKKESFSYSDWRGEIIEELGDVASSDPALEDPQEISSAEKKQIKEKKVRNKITINPSSKDINEAVDFAFEYFYKMGLDTDDVLDIIEAVGEDSFCYYVLHLVENQALETAYFNERFLIEMSVSKSQQKLFGLALAVKRGETSRSEVSQEVLDIVDSMSEAKIRDFAKTKRTGLPEKK